MSWEASHWVGSLELDQLLLEEHTEVPGFSRILIPEARLWGEEGMPALPVLTQMVELGESAAPILRIRALDSLLVDLDSVDGALPPGPLWPRGRKSTTGVDPLPPDTSYLSSESWFGGPVAQLEYEGTMRGGRLASLHIRPVQYHPAANQLKIYHRLEVVIGSAGTVNHSPDPLFRSMLRRVARPVVTPLTKALPAEAPMTLILLSDTLFRDRLGELVAWKQRKGFVVKEVYVQETGRNPSDIKARLTDLYYEHGSDRPPAFLLIVGDEDQVPPSQESPFLTDLYYATFDGEGDYLPDLFYGRISVETDGQLKAVLDKILMVETHAFPDPAYLRQALLIAGSDATFAPVQGNGHIRYAHETYLDDPSRFDVHSFLYPASDTSAGAIRDLLSQGMALVNYTGHGNYDRWQDPLFHQDDIATLTNGGKYPVMIGNGCQTNVFTLKECFAEALIRAPEKGALAYIGCTSDSYWDEDFFWAVGMGDIVSDPVYEDTERGFYDAAFHTHGEPYGEWAPSLGEMLFAGNMAVQASPSSLKRMYWEIYQLAGDPSLEPWFGEPSLRDVGLPPVVPDEAGQLDVQCEPFAYVALSSEDGLLDARHSDASGLVSLRLPDHLAADSLEVVVTGGPHRPFAKWLPRGTPAGPFPYLASMVLSGESGSADLALNPGETASFRIDLQNLGTEVFEGDTLVLRSTSSCVEILDSLLVLGPVLPGDTLRVEAGFRIRACEGLEDGVVFHLQAVLGKDSLGIPRIVSVSTRSPNLRSVGMTWDDLDPGNGNGIPEPGEWLHASLNLINRGSFPSEPLAFAGPVPTGIESVDIPDLPSLEPGASALSSFTFRLSEEASGTLPLPFFWGTTESGIGDSLRLFPGHPSEQFFQDSEPDVAWTPSGVPGWFWDPTTFVSAPYALRSPPMSHSQATCVSLDVDLAVRDSLRFAFRVSSEPAYDHLEFWVDDQMVKRWSGQRSWDEYGLPLELGWHSLRWCYRKDASVSEGEDAVWLDDLVFPAGAFRHPETELVWAGPAELVECAPSTVLEVGLQNRGERRITGLNALVGLDGQPGDTLSLETVSIAAGEIASLVIPVADSLLSPGDHEVSLRIWNPGEGFVRNNRMHLLLLVAECREMFLAWEGLETIPGSDWTARLRVENRGNVASGPGVYRWGLGDFFLGEIPGPADLTRGGWTVDTLVLLTESAVSGLNLEEGTHRLWIELTFPEADPETLRVTQDVIWGSSGSPTGDRDELKLFPNPALREVLLIPGASLRGPVRIRILSLDGRVLSSEDINLVAEGTLLRLDLEAGMYLLQLPDRSITLPLVVGQMIR
ncbi:MAG: C25 family cysteine peptidase [Bacteroidales bacterium]